MRALLPIPLLPVLFGGCTELEEVQDKPEKTVRESYDVVATLVEQDCFGSSTSEPEETSLYFEGRRGDWTAVVDVDELPCTGPDSNFVCTTESEPGTTSSVEHYLLTLEGSRDDETIDATWTLEVVCEDGAQDCLACAMNMSVVGTRAE